MIYILFKVRLHRDVCDILCNRGRLLLQRNPCTSTPSQTTGPRRIETYDRILQVEAMNGSFLFETEWFIFYLRYAVILRYFMQSRSSIAATKSMPFYSIPDNRATPDRNIRSQTTSWSYERFISIRNWTIYILSKVRRHFAIFSVIVAIYCCIEIQALLLHPRQPGQAGSKHTIAFYKLKLWTVHFYSKLNDLYSI